MKRWMIAVLVALFIGGCSGTGFEKKTTLVPDSLTLAYQEESYGSDIDQWKGWLASATWNLK